MSETPQASMETELMQMLAALYTPDEIHVWLNTKQNAFQGHSPASLIIGGHIQTVFDEVNRLYEGVYV